MTNDETVKEVGVYLYAGSMQASVRIVQRGVAYGSGDYEDPPEIANDRIGTFFYLEFSNPTDPDNFNSISGAFETIQKLKQYACTVCQNIKWNTE